MKHAISPTREENYPEWYQQVIKAADMAENSPSRGCMVIKPWGWGIWENLQKQLDARIKATGHENAYFPLFIPLSFLEREAAHVEGFAKECAVVTHHRLEASDGKLVPKGELEEPLIVRPTSETIIGDAFSRWIQSYRDLPLLLNQWANVVRWEMRPRLFLRTAEFLWQEGHTAHSTEEEAREEVMRMLEVYREFVENVLAVPVIDGEKTEGERFPGAENTYCIEAMMQDRKALQAGTSHYLGQNFAKASQIRYLDQNGELQYAHTTSWGVSTRLIGALVMTHGDDDGMRVPPRVAQKHVAVLPVIPKDELRPQVLEYTEKVCAQLREASFYSSPVEVHHDTRDIRGGEKSWQWIKKGVPLRIEAGPRDIESGKVVIFRRDKGHKEKEFVPLESLNEVVQSSLEQIQHNYLSEAQQRLKCHTTSSLQSWNEMLDYFTAKDSQKPEIHGGFALVPWAGNIESEAKLSEHKLTVRCLPSEASLERYGLSAPSGKCLLTGKEGTSTALIAKAY